MVHYCRGRRSYRSMISLRKEPLLPLEGEVSFPREYGLHYSENWLPFFSLPLSLSFSCQCLYLSCFSLSLLPSPFLSVPPSLSLSLSLSLSFWLSCFLPLSCTV